MFYLFSIFQDSALLIWPVPHPTWSKWKWTGTGSQFPWATTLTCLWVCRFPLQHLRPPWVQASTPCWLPHLHDALLSSTTATRVGRTFLQPALCKSMSGHTLERNLLPVPFVEERSPQKAIWRYLKSIYLSFMSSGSSWFHWALTCYVFELNVPYLGIHIWPYKNPLFIQWIFTKTPYSYSFSLCLYVLFALDVGFVSSFDIVMMFLYVVWLILGSHGNTHVEQCSSPKGS